ncbi:hypothetical protein R3P38DRAFT_894380 [Favolaschia claudopus]|uniref:GATA-type domain-containing protein n=1 Tax=Favolaschia claudopus TaxID=2862362 RepID=A0AAV9ZVL3_9AGAR
MSSDPLTFKSPLSFLNPSGSFDNGIDVASLVAENAQSSIPDFSLDDCPEFSSANYHYNLDPDYARESSQKVPSWDKVSLSGNPCSLFDEFFRSEHGVSDMSLAAPTLDAPFISSNEWGSPSHNPQVSSTPLMGDGVVKGDGVNAHHRVDSSSNSSTSVGSFKLPNNPPIDRLTSDPIDNHHKQFCERLMHMMNQESINPGVVLNFMRRKDTAARAGLSSRRHRTIHRDARVCSECGVQKTKQWRYHPTTALVLCNPCGQRANRARMSA